MFCHLFFAYWVDRLDPFLIQFTQNFGIRYYGLAYLSGFAVGYWLLHRYWKKGISPLSPPQQADAIFALILGVCVGGRLGYFIFYAPYRLIDHPLDLFKVWDGGMASHGGFIGVFIALLWISRSQKIPLFRLADIGVSLAPAGLFFGRIANFINGELYGKISYVSWAVIYPKSAPAGTPIADIAPRHPSELYEAALEGLFLFIYTQWRIWRTPVAKRNPGQLSGEFLILYAIVRIFCEQFRQPDKGVALLYGMSRGTVLSIVTLIIGFALFVYARRHPATNQDNKPST